MMQQDRETTRLQRPLQSQKARQNTAIDQHYSAGRHGV
jgi:hypothetical protein